MVEGSRERMGKDALVKLSSYLLPLPARPAEAGVPEGTSSLEQGFGHK